MQIKKLDHSALVVRDLARARWFYGQVLQLDEVPRPRNFTFGGTWFRGQGFELHLVVASDTTAPAGFGALGEAARTGLAHHLAFQVADLDATIHRLHAFGIELLAGPMPRGDGVIQIYVSDPDGHLLEFFMWDHDATLPVRERGAVPGGS